MLSMKKKLSISLLTIISAMCLPLSSCNTKQKEDKFYNVTFQNYDGTVLQTKIVKEGNTTSYDGNTPTKDKDDNYVYKFKSWDSSFEPIYKDTTYTAQYNPIERIVVKWTDADGKQIGDDDDTDVESVCYKGTVPSKQEGSQYYYFDGWTVEEEKSNDEYKKKTYIAKPKFEKCEEDDDRDYDGCPDHLDPTPLDSNFNTEIKYTYDEGLDDVTIKNADFKFDFKKMLVDADNNEYSKDLAKFCAIINHNNIHGSVKFTENITPKEEYDTFYDRLGFNDKHIIKTNEINDDKDPNDHIKADIYYKKVNAKNYSTSNGNDNYRDLFLVQLDFRFLPKYVEWESNIDIGLNDEEYFDKEGKKEKHDQSWLDNPKYYKSFFVAASRMEPLLASYISSKCETAEKPIILLTGHSRCASIANVLGALLNNDTGFNKKLFVYTFAPCFTYWGDADTNNNNIYNICNNDDVVTHFPFDFITDEDKNLNRHGITKTLSISSDLNATYKNRTNSSYAYINNPISVLKKYLNGITRKDIYTCNDVTKLSKNKSVYIDIIRKMNPKLTEDQINKYFVFEETNNGLTVKTCLESYAHVLLGLTDGSGHMPTEDQMKAALELVDNYYYMGLSLYTRIVGDPTHSLALPHYMTSYYLIADAL